MCVYIKYTHTLFHSDLKLFVIFLIENIHTSLFLSATSTFEKMNFTSIDFYLFVYVQCLWNQVCGEIPCKVSSFSRV